MKAIKIHIIYNFLWKLNIASESEGTVKVEVYLILTL